MSQRLIPALLSAVKLESYRLDNAIQDQQTTFRRIEEWVVNSIVNDDLVIKWLERERDALCEYPELSRSLAYLIDRRKRELSGEFDE